MQNSAVDPRAAAEARRTAMRAYERARRRRLNMVLGGAVAAIALADVAYMVLSSGSRNEPTSPTAAANAQVSPPVESANAAPPAPLPQATASSEATPPAPTEPGPAPKALHAANDKPAEPPASKPAPKMVEAVPAAPRPQADDAPIRSPGPAPTSPARSGASSRPETTAAQATSAGPAAPPASATAPDQGQLQRDEVREVQSRLRSFGFNPGPVDGSAGPMTEAAVARYQQNRAEAATGKVDRQLLDELRQDPAPQVAQRTPPTQYRSGQYSSGSTQRSPSNEALAAIRMAGARITQWLNSISR